jgi:hypothetical protein
MPLDTALTSSEWRGSRRPSQSHLSAATGAMPEKGSRNMSSQEELVRCLRKLTEALAAHDARRLSVVRQHDRLPGAPADEAPVRPDQDVVDPSSSVG